MDNREFIARHHESDDPAQKRGRLLSPETMITAAAIFILGFLAVAIYLVPGMQTAYKLTIVAVCVILMLLAFWASRIYSQIRNRSRKLDIITRVLDGSRGGRLITDEQGRTLYANDKFSDICLTDPQGRAGLADLQNLFAHNEQAQSHFDLLHDQARRGLGDTIDLVARDERHERWISVTAQPLDDMPGTIHWRIDDVTQRYQLERSIREEREKLIDFTDNAPVGFFSLNEEGKFVFANATFARWIGEDLRTLLDQGRLHTYLVDPPAGGRPFDLVPEPKPRQVVEIRMKGAAGSVFLASINQVIVEEPGGRVRTRAVVHDLTTEREMYQALQASEDKFERFFEEAPLGIILITPKGEIADCNASFAQMLKSEPRKLEGLKFADLIDESDDKDVMAAINKIEQGQQMAAPLEVILKRHDGTVIQAQMHARRFREGGDIALHFIDLSEKKALEEQFVQSQKMQAIGQLAGGVAHDFNNLLTAITGFCDLLLLRHKPGDPSFSDIMQIKQNSNRAANLVRQLLAFSRQQTLRPHVQDITDILTEVSHLIRRLIGAGIELNLVHGTDLGLVKVDEGQMEQVLINLAVNARDAMEGAGHLTIETENYTTREPVELVSEELPPGHWTLIKVSDTGCGISKNIMSRIFEPFFTTKEVGAGTGLGLATVYGIIRQTDGFLDVKSTPGEGTTFYIYLPQAIETEEEETKEDVPEEGPRDLTGTERILLVEDEDAVRTFSQRALTNKGYEVLTAESGDGALSVLEGLDGKTLDLLITDVVMPNMDGPTLAQRVRQNNKDLKIIFISGYTEEKLKDYMGTNIWFLPKPFTLKQLAEKVKEVLED